VDCGLRGCEAARAPQRKDLTREVPPETESSPSTRPAKQGGGHWVMHTCASTCTWGHAGREGAAC
jgi:hypothetical protein